MALRIRLGTLYVYGLAILTAILGGITILSAATPTLQSRLVLLDGIVSTLIQQGAALATVLLGFILLVLAISLWQRKRTAWLLTVALLALSIVLHLLKGLDYEEAFLSLVLMLGLLATNNQFHTKSDTPSIRFAVPLLVITLLATLLYSTLGLTLLQNHFSPQIGFIPNLQNTLRLFYDPAAITTQATTSFGLYFIASVYVLAVVDVSSSVILLSRSVIVRQTANEAERKRARQIVEQYGNSSVAYFALLEDKSYFFSKNGTVIAYVVKNNIALALGDPIGRQTNIPQTIQEFRAFAKQYGWQVAFYQVLPDYLDDYRAQTLKVLPIGQEAVVDIKGFTLSGNARKTMRQHYNHVAKRGYRVELHQPPFDDAFMDNLQAISDDWLAEVNGTEKRFSLGWFYDAYLQDNPIMGLYNVDDELCAFVNILPEYQRNEVTIDMMRYRGDVDSGVMDFLFVSLCLWAQEQGYDSFNLGLVALAGVGDEPTDPRIERALHYLYEHLNQFYNFKGLYKFKSKFNPDWQYRYLIYPNTLALPSVAIALVRADSGDDFIWTYLREWRLEQFAKWREQRAARRQASTPSTELPQSIEE